MPTTDTMARLHARLEHAADADQALDVAYRTIDTPVGTLLLAATTVGLVRVAYDIEGHDAVLTRLADAVSPRILRAPSRLDAVARQIDEYFAKRRTTFDVPVDLRLPTDSDAASSSTCATSTTAAGRATRPSPPRSATPAPYAPSVPRAATIRFRWCSHATASCAPTGPRAST